MPAESEWLVPRPTAEQLFALAAAKMEIKEAASTAPEVVTALALTLSEQAVLMQAIIRQATHRIAELERTAPRCDAHWLEVARDLCPGPF